MKLFLDCPISELPGPKRRHSSGFWMFSPVADFKIEIGWQNYPWLWLALLSSISFPCLPSLVAKLKGKSPNVLINKYRMFTCNAISRNSGKHYHQAPISAMLRNYPRIYSRHSDPIDPPGRPGNSPPSKSLYGIPSASNEFGNVRGDCGRGFSRTRRAIR
jgi:hypothetical protein